MKKTASLGLAVALFLSGGAQGHAQTSQANTVFLAYDLARELTTEIGARPAGSRAEARARAWAVERLRGLGFQNVRDESFEIDVWRRGAERAHLTFPSEHALVVTGLGGSVATPRRGVEAPVAFVESFDALVAAPETAFVDRIVFVNDRMTPSRDGAGYGSALRKRSQGASEAARRGAIALLIRSVGTGTDRFGHAGMLSYRPDAPRIPAAAISAPDADLLERHAASGSEMRVRLLLRPTTERNAVSGNIVADLPGSDIASEIVLLGAHLDSWDLGQGALDDAAGVAMVIEAALRAAGPDLRARRTIRVVLFGAEEISGRGGQDYATRHAGDTHVLATEADFGAARIWGYFTNVPESDLPFFDSVGRDLASMGIERGHNRAQGGEDIRPLRRAGVPVVSLVQDGTTYFDFHHTANDTFDKIDPAALEQNVQVFSILTERVADR